MQLFELQQKMNTRTLPKFMVFIGSEYKIKNLYINQISKITNTNITNIDDCTTLLTLGKVASLLDENNLYVCRYNKSILTMNKYWDSFEGKLGNNYCVLILEDIDKRGKFYNKFKSKSVFEFNKQPFDTVVLMLKNCGLSKIPLECLINDCECDYSKILEELDKIKSYSNYCKISLDESYIKLKKFDILSTNKSSTVERLQDEIMTRNPHSFMTIKELKEKQEPAIKIVGYLYNAFRQQLMVQSHFATPQSTGLSQYVISMCSKRNNIYTTQKLVKNVYLLKDVEQGLKNGKYDEDFGLDYLITNLL